MSSAAARRAGYQPERCRSSQRRPGCRASSAIRAPAAPPSRRTPATTWRPRRPGRRARRRQRRGSIPPAFPQRRCGDGRRPPAGYRSTRALRHRHERCVADDDDGGDERHDRDGRTGGAEPLVTAATNVRDASGVIRSKVSAADGLSWRRARIDPRGDPGRAGKSHVIGFANTCRLGAAPNARSNAVIGIQRSRSSDTPPEVPCRAMMPTMTKRRPAMRTACPSGSTAGNRASITFLTGDDDLCPVRIFAGLANGRPRSIPTSRITNSVACVPLSAALSNVRPPALTSAARCTVAA